MYLLFFQHRFNIFNLLTNYSCKWLLYTYKTKHIWEDFNCEKNLIVIVTLLCMVFLFCSCSSRSSSANQTDIIGQWKIYSKSFNESDLYSVFGSSLKNEGNSLEFHEDGTFSVYIGAGYGGDGQYSYSDNIIDASFKDYCE